jgi:hypothetical protein
VYSRFCVDDFIGDNTMSDYYHARARLAQVLTDVEAYLRQRGIGTETKGVNEVVRAFADAITNLVYDTMNGRITAGEMSRALRRELRDAADVAFSEGKKEGGGDTTLTVDDQKTIGDWLETQMPHVLQFAKDAAAVQQADDKDFARAEIVRRAALWTDNIMTVGNMGYAAGSDKYGTWKFGDTVDHCDTCQGLNGKRKKLSWFVDNGYIPQQRGSDKLECGGWQCQCVIVGDDGKVLMP